MCSTTSSGIKHSMQKKTKQKTLLGALCFSSTSPTSRSHVRSHCTQAGIPGHELVCRADAKPFFGWDMSELISATNLQKNPEDWRTAGGRLLCFACCLFRQFVSAHCPPEFSNLLCPSVFSCLLTKIFGAGAVFFIFIFFPCQGCMTASSAHQQPQTTAKMNKHDGRGRTEGQKIQLG